MAEMNREVLQVVESVSNEKGVSEGVIFEAIEVALAMATKRRYQADAEFAVAIDRQSGNYETTRRWLVIDPDRELDEEEQQQLRVDMDLSPPATRTPSSLQRKPRKRTLISTSATTTACRWIPWSSAASRHRRPSK